MGREYCASVKKNEDMTVQEWREELRSVVTK